MRKTLFPLLLAGLAVLMLGCSASRNVAYPSGMYFYDSPPTPAGVMQEGASDQPISERKVLYSAQITMAVADPDTASARIGSIAARYGGYLSRGGTYQTVIRVRSIHLQAALADIAALGKLIDQSVTGQDVTDQYHDYRIRLENAERARSRYLALLEQAASVEEALKVEKELERLNETIELMKGKMARIEHLDQFSTITVYHREKIKPGPVGYLGVGVWHVVKWLFVRN